MTDQDQQQTLGLPELIAMGVGGMIGGGIFSVLGMAVSITGHAAPFAFALGGLVAMLAGYSYIKLALAYHSDGASFTYLERAFPSHPNTAGLAGWTVVVGYVGTLALYAFTFGAYGAHLLGSSDSLILRRVLSTGVLLFFMVVNLRGAKASGVTEDLIVYGKIILLSLFAIAGLFAVKSDHLIPAFDRGAPSVLIAGALIFVAYEGFQLITNAVVETKHPEKNIPRGIYGSIIITSGIYITLSVVAVGSLTVSELIAAEEYALAVAAQPVLGYAGQVLVGVAALMATSSAINATSFGASRMMAEMATEQTMPKVFSFRNRTRVPWVAVVVLTLVSIVFSLFGGLETIAAFSSMTFLVVSVAVSIANFRLRSKTHSNPWMVLSGTALMALTIVLLLAYLWLHQRQTFLWIAVLYTVITVTEFVFCKRACSIEKADA